MGPFSQQTLTTIRTENLTVARVETAIYGKIFFRDYANVTTSQSLIVKFFPKSRERMRLVTSFFDSLVYR